MVQSDALLLPSLRDDAPFVVAEAQAVGLPVVAFEQGGPRVFAGFPGSTVLVVPLTGPDPAGALAEGLRRVPSAARTTRSGAAYATTGITRFLATDVRGRYSGRHTMLINRLKVPALVTGVAVSIGFLIDASPQAALGVVLVAGAAAALGAPAARWVGAAIVATLSFRALVFYGLLPSTATFVDMFLAWGALAAALSRHRRLPSQAAWPLRLLVGLTLCALASAALNRSELLRPVVYVLLLGTPFAVVIALVIDRPSARDRRWLSRVLLAALLVQIPFALAQSTAGKDPDVVQGTLIGAGAGAHVISAITMVGAIWVLLTLPRTLAVRLAIAVPLILITFLADAKQVLLAAPVMLIAGNWRGKRDAALRIPAAALAFVALLNVVPAGDTAKKFIEANSQRSKRQGSRRDNRVRCTQN